jgi:GTP-binding protein EngB required for normal cell division
MTPARSEAPLGVLAELCEAFRLTTLEPQLRACEAMIREAGVVDVVVLGAFKAGKSSFLNSLLGAELLPVGVLPLTALVTRLAYGPEDRLEVAFQGGERRILPVSALPEYVTESANPENGKQVAAVDLTTAALAPFRGLRFVDTPGLGSVFQHNTRAALDWLPRVGGALLAIPVNQPFSEQDLALLKEVARHTPEIALLVTKADLVTPGQLEQILDFTQHQAAQALGRPVRVLPYSTHPGLGALREAVRHHLLARVAGEHEELARAILDHKLRALQGACREYLSLALGAAEASAESREALQAAIAQERAALAAIRGEVAVLIRDLQTRARSRAADHFLALRPAVARDLRAHLAVEMKGWTGHLGRRRERFEEWLETALRAAMAEASPSGHEVMAACLLEAQASLQRQVRAFQDRLAEAIHRALGLNFEGARFQAEIVAPRQPDIRIGKVFDTQVDLLWFLLPMGLLGPFFERHFLKRLPWEAEKGLSRLANQWAEAGQASLQSLVAQALDFMRQELSTLESFTLGAEDRRADLKEALRTLADLTLPAGLDKAPP